MLSTNMFKLFSLHCLIDFYLGNKIGYDILPDRNTDGLWAPKGPVRITLT